MTTLEFQKIPAWPATESREKRAMIVDWLLEQSALPYSMWHWEGVRTLYIADTEGSSSSELVLAIKLKFGHLL